MGEREREEERDTHTPRICFRGVINRYPIGWLLLLGEVHAPQQVLEAAVGTEGVEMRKHCEMH